MYATLQHASSGSGHDCAASFLELAKTEKQTKKEAIKSLKQWISQRQNSCNISECQHSSAVIGKLTPEIKMFASHIKSVR
ncbi:hypothetical protein HY250_02315 [Candidatus Azambacteria bacterium]|nr:hypothetical protein [Candidatus Azambacteria bacterium]